MHSVQLIILLPMNLHINARELSSPIKDDKLHKKEIAMNYQSIVLKQFYERLTKKHSIKNKAIMLFGDELNSNPETREVSPLLNESEFCDDKMQEKQITLPILQTRQNDSFRQKIIVNQTVFIHERLPIKASDVTFTKKLSLQQGEKQKKRSNLHPFGSLSSKRVTDLQIVQMNSSIRQKNNFDIFLPKHQLVRHKSNQKMKQPPNADIITYPTQVRKCRLKLKADKSSIEKHNIHQIYHHKSRIQKIIDHYKAIKQKRQRSQMSIRQRSQMSMMDNNMIYSIQNRQKIKVWGEQTVYCQKDKRAIKKKQSSITSISKIKYVNWKIKELPFTEIPKFEVTRLMTMYLSTKEAVPAVSGNYKVYVGQGNNGQLVARLLKNRGWWTITQDIAEANLIWTQLPFQQQMKRVSQHEQIVLTQHPKEYLLFSGNQPLDGGNQLLGGGKISKFLKYKQTPFFNACQKLLYGPIYSKYMLQFISKFMENQYVKNYSALKDQIYKFYPNRQLLKVQSKNLTVVNHCGHSCQIGDKKQLFYHIQKYCQINKIHKFTMVPKTVHINEDDIEKIKAKNTQTEIEEYLKQFQIEDRLYILKPGEESNRGNGITVHQTKQSLIQHLSHSFITFPEHKTFIVQEYIDPLLYDGRKFDIRVWALYSNNRLWFYREGYVRTSCKEYNTKNMNKFIHLTNDAVQKHSEQYGKYQPANKVSFNELDKYLKKTCNYHQFYSQIYTHIQKLTTKLFQVGNLMIGKSCHQFQLFGLDFLIDKNFKVWLIECNTNPSIEICCSLLNRLVPNMLQNLLTIAVDPLFPAVERKAFKEDFEWSPEKFNFQLLLDGTINNSYLETISSSDPEYLNELTTINGHKLKNFIPIPPLPKETDGEGNA